MTKIESDFMHPKALEDGSKGLIFNIQRFCIHDGPGIRTTVFMKGCPLRCFWCSNPESQDFLPNLMARDSICKRCGACAAACKRGAITVHEAGRHIDRRQCGECMEMVCVCSCIYGSLTTCGNYLKPEEVLEEVLKDQAFYRNSGGGVTVSGGEPLSQAGFVGHLLALCKDAGLHTALDTSGYAPWETFEKVLRFVDLVLFDIKHLDPEKHRALTGVDNHLIMENLKRVSKDVSVWLRVPLIAGTNDAREEIIKLAQLGRSVEAEQVTLLPFHEGGMSKTLQFGRTNRLPDAAPPTPEHINLLKELITAEGVAVSIGK